MDEENRKLGRKRSGHKHGGKDMKAGQAHKATKKVGSGKGRGLTLLERERSALAEATPPGPAPVAPPATKSPQEVEARPTSFADVVEKASDVAPPAPESVETEASRQTVGVGPAMRRGTLAVIACGMVAICGVALVRAGEASGTPTENDAAEAGSCSDDASMCVARA